jgi:CPA2 family monovalent cation:H+ antiporter-2
MHSDIKIVLILTFGFALASFFGFIAKKLKLPTILGFMIAGYLIGPHSPGFIADSQIAEELAEIGVILMLFSVGLHFKLTDLYKVKKIAIPGAIIQTSVTTLFTLALTYSMGFSIFSGIVLGLTIGVASTFVMAKALADHHLLNTWQGHIAIGWLVVEDIFTVIILVILPLIATSSTTALISSIVIIFAKFTLLCLIAFTIGYRVITFSLTKIAETRSEELLMLAVLAFVFVIATASSFIFGTSLALGAFISGMVIGKTKIKYQAAIHSLSLKDIFTIIFFLSVGMLLNPITVINHLYFFFGILGIIIFIKPLIAFVLIVAYRLPLKIALTVAFALAQIGEFSFILLEQATTLNLLPVESFDIIIACALISICLNPSLFRFINWFEKNLHKIPFFAKLDLSTVPIKNKISVKEPRAIVVGYGPLGQESVKILKTMSYSIVVIEHNIDTVKKNDKNIEILYGNAAFKELLETAGASASKLLIITASDIEAIKNIILAAREINPRIKILTRISYIEHIELMEQLSVSYICPEEETLKALHNTLLTMGI